MARTLPSALDDDVYTDHLERLVLARQEGVECWRTDCGRKTWCEVCSLRWRAEGA